MYIHVLYMYTSLHAILQQQATYNMLEPKLYMHTLS